MINTRPNIWQLHSRRDVSALTNALRYPDPEVRKRAAVALRTLDAVQAVPALKRALQQETDAQVRLHFSTALHVLDERTDIESLIKQRDVHSLIQALKSRHPENVIRTARELGKLGDRLAVEPLVILFHDAASPPLVRLAAAEALLELKSAPAVVTLLGALRRDSWEVRRNAAAVLGQIQATWAVEPLAEALDDAHPVVRRAAAAALQRIGTAEALHVLRERYENLRPPRNAPGVPAQVVLAAAASPVASSPPTRPAPPHLEVHDTQPVPIPERPSVPTGPAPTPVPLPAADRASRIRQPVLKLIAFFKQHA